MIIVITIKVIKINVTHKSSNNKYNDVQHNTN